MKRRWRRFLLLAIGIIVLVATTILIIDRCSPKYKFPIWQQAVYQEGSPAVNQEVTLTLSGIDFNVDSGNGVTDIVHVAAKITSDGTAYGVDYWIDYCYNDKWYTVYDSSTGKDVAKFLNGPGESSLEYSVPVGLFKQKGQYRLYVSSLGYCDIDILLSSE